MARFNRDPHGHRQEASRAFELEFLSVARGMAHAAAGTAQRRIPQRGLSHEQVRELEHRMRDVYENLPVAVFAIDAAHRINDFCLSL